MAESGESSLKALLGEDDTPVEQLSAARAKLNEATPLRPSILGSHLDAVLTSYCNLMSIVGTNIPVPLPVDPVHIKETTEYHIKTWRDSCFDLSTEFTRIGMRWNIEHPEDKWKDEIAALKKAIERQESLLKHVKGVLEKRTDEFFSNPNS